MPKKDSSAAPPNPNFTEAEYKNLVRILYNIVTVLYSFSFAFVKVFNSSFAPAKEAKTRSQESRSKIIPFVCRVISPPPQQVCEESP
jgi:hypothetical protein